jgi:lambda family phage portal protein
MNVLDRFIGVLSPERALQRARARTTLTKFESLGPASPSGDFNSASRTKRSLRSWLPRLFSAASQADGKTTNSLSPREVVMARARDLVRNSPLAAGALDTLCASAVGTGLTLQSHIDYTTLKMEEEKAREWQRITETQFAAWAESQDCDVTRTLNFYGVQELALRSSRENGDVFFLMPMRPPRPDNDLGLTVQLVEADRVATPPKTVVQDLTGIIGGIEIDTYGAPKTYWVSNDASGDSPNRKFTPYSAFDRKGRRQFFHVMRVKRIGQRRGMSYFAPVLDFFKTLGDYSDAELQAALIASFFTVFVSSKSGATLPPMDFQTEGTGGGAGADTDDDEIKMGAGAVVELPGDTTVNTANPGRPNAGFDPFVQAILRQIGVGLQIPYEVLVKHFTSSYSAARASMLDAWRFFSMEREFLGTYFCQPIYERWLDFMVAKGKITAPGYFDSPEIRRAYRACAWVGDGPGSLDPVKEVAAAEKRLTLGISDLDEECIAYSGQTYTEKHPRIAKIAELRREAGLLVAGGEPPVIAVGEPIDTEDPEDTKDTEDPKK